MPATPIAAPASARSTDARVQGRVDVGDRSEDLLLRGRVAVQVALVEPHGADVEGVARHDGAVGAAEDQLGRATADVDHEQRLRQGREVTRRTGEADPGLLETVEHLGLDADALAHAGRRTPRRSPRPGRRRWRRTGSRARRARARSPCTPRWRLNTRCSEASAIRPVRSTPWPSRTMRSSRTRSVLVPASTSMSATSSRSEFVPQSKAATRVMASPHRWSRTVPTSTSRRARRAPRRRAG